ncbi:13825_t:CDS:2 [Funneliformis mosseae]|uniref:Non-homologous end-joining factor 1 n=1 Tax=Funneliformis mosseae TaxID=27381 RepID=A0A9N9B5L6_FUNMO|nr:13825_t:CDS:2 [Funneliformis mosseae]
MAFTNTHSETLRSSTWVPLVARVDDPSREEPFLVKSIFTENSYLVLFTDLRYVWFEELFDEYLLPQRSDITHKVTKGHDGTFLFESKRTIGPMELVWKFHCDLIPSSLPMKSPNSNVQQIDGVTVLYTHFILPQILITSAYNKQLEILHNAIKSKEDEFNETVRLMSLVRLQHKFDKNAHTEPPSFDPKSSYDEIEKNIQNFEVLDSCAPLNICEGPIFSKLFKTATERVIAQTKVIPENKYLQKTSYSSGAPSITTLENISQIPTMKLPSLSDSQLSKMFTPHVLSLEDGVNPSQASTIELPTIDSFHDSQSKDEEELTRIQAEEEIEKARRAAEDAKAREREKRQHLKDLAVKQAEKAAKKRKKVI